MKVTQEQRGNDRLLKIAQTRFLADGSSDGTARWKIPINICTKSNPNESVHQLFMNGEDQQEFLLEKVSESDWIKLNLFRYVHSSKAELFKTKTITTLVLASIA